MPELDDMAIFARSVRRHIRNHALDRGEIPSMCAVVSGGANPRKLHGSMSLHLLSAAAQRREQIAGMVREHGSRFAAWAVTVPHEDGQALVLEVVDAARAERWFAPVDGFDGVGAWERSTVVPDGLGWVQELIEREA